MFKMCDELMWANVVVCSFNTLEALWNFDSQRRRARAQHEKKREKINPKQQFIHVGLSVSNIFGRCLCVCVSARAQESRMNLLLCSLAPKMTGKKDHPCWCSVWLQSAHPEYPIYDVASCAVDPSWCYIGMIESCEKQCWKSFSIWLVFAQAKILWHRAHRPSPS